MAQVFTMEDALTECGVLNDTNNIIFNRSNAAQRISSEVFSDSFMTCLDLTFSDLEDNWKTYSSLAMNQGQIRLRLGTKVNIKALIQWVRDHIRLNEDPTIMPFLVIEQWIDDASDMAKNTMPKPLKR